VASEVKVSNRANFFTGVFIGGFPLILAAGSAQLGGVLGALLVVFFLGLFVLALVRASRMAVVANEQGLIIRNLGRDYQLPWAAVSGVEAGRSDNITGAVTTLFVRRADGSSVVGRGASSYSRAKVERWRDAVLSARPGA
jgi:hypothetical protein